MSHSFFIDKLSWKSHHTPLILLNHIIGIFVYMSRIEKERKWEREESVGNVREKNFWHTQDVVKGVSFEIWKIFSHRYRHRWWCCCVNIKNDEGGREEKSEGERKEKNEWIISDKKHLHNFFSQPTSLSNSQSFICILK